MKEEKENKGIIQKQRRNKNFFKLTSRRGNKKNDYFIRKHISVNHKDVDNLSRFMNKQGRIMSRNQSKLTAKNQRLVSRSIKTAIKMGLICPMGAKKISS